MELEVGMYIRFKDKRNNTYIRKIKDIAVKYPEKLYYGIRIDKEANYTNYLSIKNILKASYNITDLIEVGDYVNGGALLWSFVDNEDIKSVVTKEQFENMKYEVK